MFRVICDPNPKIMSKPETYEKNVVDPNPKPKETHFNPNSKYGVYLNEYGGFNNWL